MTTQNTAVVPVFKELPAGPSRPFVEQIRMHWRQSFQAILATGIALLKARKDLGEELFKNMVEKDLPFGRSTASMLMVIAKDERIAKFHNYEIWPNSWWALYELTHIKKDEDFYRAISDGRIKPDMTIEDAKKIVKHPDSPTVRNQNNGGTGGKGDKGAKNAAPPESDNAPDNADDAQDHPTVAVSFTLGEWELIKSVMIAADHAGIVERVAKEVWPEDVSTWECAPPRPDVLAQKLGILTVWGLKAIGDGVVEGVVMSESETP
ncbi:MAG: hypothetical protein HQL99_15335 [Magnetococcales bacterium]|nr:hypothetical protein [Magnetococcales bacterium]